MNEVKVHCNIGLIGDALCAMPFLHELSKCNKVIAGPNINKWILEGLDFPITFDPNFSLQSANYHLDASRAWHHCGVTGSVYHMAQGHYLANRFTPPKLPLSIPLKFQDCKLEPGIVVAPFSASDHNGNKFWPVDRWLRLFEHFPDPVYVVGASKDDFDWLSSSKAIPIIDESMPYINSMLKKCKMLVSIDTGISHVAHMLSMSNHALLYSHAVPNNFVLNPNGLYIKAWPRDVTVEMMLTLCKQIKTW